MKMNKKFISILILCGLLISQQDMITNKANLKKVDKKKYTKLFQQARTFERNGLFDEFIC